MKGPRNAIARLVLGQSLDKRPHSSVKDTRKAYNDATFETITKTISRAPMLDNSDRFALPKQVREELENFLKPHGRHLDEMKVVRDPKTEKYTIADSDGFTVSFIVKGEEPKEEEKIPDDGYRCVPMSDLSKPAQEKVQALCDAFGYRVFNGLVNLLQRKGRTNDWKLQYGSPIPLLQFRAKDSKATRDTDMF